jgi:hypothetical protein
MRDIASTPFDFLLAVFFNEDLELQEIWKVPCEVVCEARFVARTNSTRFVMTPAVESDDRVKRLV